MQTKLVSFHDTLSLQRQLASLQTSGFAPTVGLFFCSLSQNFEAATRFLGQYGVTVVGATTAGEIANNEVLEDAGVVLLMEIPCERFDVHILSNSNGRTEQGTAQQIGQLAVEKFTHPILFVFASGLSTNGEAVVRGIQAGVGRSLPLFGGLAGDDMTMENTYVFSNDHTTNNGLIALVLDGDYYQAEGLATSGWQPVGVEKTITHAEGNIVYTIDGEPALDVYEKYFSLSKPGSSPGKIVNTIGVNFPLSVQRDDGHTVLRAPLFNKENSKALVFAGTVSQDATVKFCVPPSFSIVESVIDESGSVKRTLPNADALILVSCKARHSALGPLVEDEIDGLHGLWHHAIPMAGFFSYGEIGPAHTQQCDFHNETCMLVALGER